jgi:hypothetical protein
MDREILILKGTYIISIIKLFKDCDKYEDGR